MRRKKRRRGGEKRKRKGRKSEMHGEGKVPLSDIIGRLLFPSQLPGCLSPWLLL